MTSHRTDFRLGPAAQQWFEANFPQPTAVQAAGWPLIAAGHHCLLLAPTGSGKTLAAFLACLSRLVEKPEVPTRTRLLYVSPLKALVYDIERNLRAPLAGLARYAGGQLPQVAIRTGDSDPRERRRQLTHPSEILVTTPESLYLMLGSQMARQLAEVETVIVDEIHSLTPTKRGAHLALSLERLSQLCNRDPQRIGLSATVEPVEVVARFLGGHRPVEIVNTLEPPKLHLEIIMPRLEAAAPGGAAAPLGGARPPQGGGSILGQLALTQGSEGSDSLWTAMYPRLLELIDQHQSTLIFVNSRGLCERLALRLNELAGHELVRSHHGSVSHQERSQIEEQLKAGQLKALVATSSLELGIDMGSIDLVILVESPGSVARGLQRVGRAGHSVGELSRAKIFPKFRGDLLECTVVAQLMRQGKLEAISYPENPLDILAQQIVAMVSQRDWTRQELEQLLQRSANYRRLTSQLLVEVLDMLSGRYPSQEFSDLKARLTWDRSTDLLTTRKGSGTLALINGGTIPDRGLYRVTLGPGGPRVGELDEEMVHEIRAGQNFLLGASTWRVEEITRDTVYVSPAPGQPGRMPFWRGDSPGRPLELGRALGAFLRQHPQAEQLVSDWGLDDWAAQELVEYLQAQSEAVGHLPSDRCLTVEYFRDEIGDWKVCLLSPLGRRVHAPWALALEAKLGFDTQLLYTDDGIVLSFPDCEAAPEMPPWDLDPDEVEDLLIQQLANSALFAAQFRENAGRALLLPRKNPQQRTPLWAQRLRAQNLLAIALEHPTFPIVHETYRSCLQDTFDLPALKQVLQDLRSRRLRLQRVETASPSPFARSLVFSYVAAYLYQGDAPLAERRAQALTLDRQMLSELLGRDELRNLLDLEVLEELVAEMQGQVQGRLVNHPDDLHHLLRRLGDLDRGELEVRCQDLSHLQTLGRARRAVEVRIGGESRWIAVEDVASYRDALGVVPPAGLPASFLEPAQQPVESLLLRYARCRGPFSARDLTRRFGLALEWLQPLLQQLVARQQLLCGEFLPGGQGEEYCDPTVMRRWKKRTLAKLRGQVAPVESSALARFLWHWQTSRLGLLEVLIQLEGLPLSFSELEGSILPARLPRFQPRQLDDLGQQGEICWVGCGSLGNRDGKVRLFRRSRAQLFLEKPETDSLGDLHRAILEYLSQRGACFVSEIRQKLAPAGSGSGLEEAVLDLIWSGHLTNDVFTPLRGNRRGVQLAGRWSLVESLLSPVSPTERAHAWVQTWLERYGLVTREVIQFEGVAGGYQAHYPLLKAMEEAGKLRRGLFVEGLRGSQFALPGVIDQLRQLPQAAEASLNPVQVLCATDPANPYGSLLPWPGKGRRIAGARVLLLEGKLAAFLEKGLRRLYTYPALSDSRCLQALVDLAPQLKGRMLRILEIDGQPALQSDWSPRFLEAGFRRDLDGLMILASPLAHGTRGVLR